MATEATRPEVEADHEEEHIHEEADVHFEPIVKLEAVDVQTLEESEDVLFLKRARLYRYDAKAGEWKERGTGDLKLLKHKETGIVRLLMRREKTLKICANHRVGVHMDLQPHQGSNRTWVYTCAADFADEEPRHEVFAVRFGDQEKATEFQTAFNEAKVNNAKITGETIPEKNEEEAASEESESEEESETEVTEQMKKLEVKEEKKGEEEKAA